LSSALNHSVSQSVKKELLSVRPLGPTDSRRPRARTLQLCIVLPVPVFSVQDNRNAISVVITTE